MLPAKSNTTTLCMQLGKRAISSQREKEEKEIPRIRREEEEKAEEEEGKETGEEEGE